MFKSILTISTLLSVTAAQLNLSQQCTNALTNIATSRDANACLTPTPLLSILTDTSKSIVGAVDEWLKSLCAAPACSNATLAAIVQNATTGCSAEFGSIGFQASDLSSVTAIIQQYYPTARKIVCLKDGNTNCITQTLTNVQNAIGTLSISNIANLGSSDLSDKITPNITCTDCVKAAYNTITTDIPGVFSPNGVQETCGTPFTDGATPPGIVQTASDQSAANTNTQGSSATGLGSTLLGSPIFVLIGGIFALSA